MGASTCSVSASSLDPDVARSVAAISRRRLSVRPSSPTMSYRVTAGGVAAGEVAAAPALAAGGATPSPAAGIETNANDSVSTHQVVRIARLISLPLDPACSRDNHTWYRERTSTMEGQE